MVWLLTRVERHRLYAFVYRLLVILVLLGASGCSAAQGVFDGSPATPSASPAIKISLPPEPPLVRAFWSISKAWKTGNPASCGTEPGFATLNGHLYVVDLHGKFVGSSAAPEGATTYVSVMVGLVPAADLAENIGGFDKVPVGADGQPLCWSLLPG
jgi:hypothetical protein